MFRFATWVFTCQLTDPFQHMFCFLLKINHYDFTKSYSFKKCVLFKPMLARRKWSLCCRSTNVTIRVMSAHNIVSWHEHCLFEGSGDKVSFSFHDLVRWRALRTASLTYFTNDLVQSCGWIKIHVYECNYTRCPYILRMLFCVSVLIVHREDMFIYLFIYNDWWWTEKNGIIINQLIKHTSINAIEIFNVILGTITQALNVFGSCNLLNNCVYKYYLKRACGCLTL